MGQARILVGQIGQAHGLKGEVKLQSFTEQPLDIAHYGTLEGEDGKARFTIKSLKRQGSGLIARFAGIEDRTRAEGLKGLKLYVGRDQLPPLEKDSYYHADLIGLRVMDAGKEIGKVVQVLNFGGGDLLEVQPAATAEPVLVPFAGARVDLGQGVIEVELAEGLLERE
jgi:16S rRNA processing protein RimM